MKPLTTRTDADVEQAAFDWHSSLLWLITHGQNFVPDMLNVERDDYGQVVLEQRLRDTFARLNSGLSTTALDNAVPQADPCR